MCVGETLEQRNAGQTTEVVSRQITAVLASVGIEGIKSGVIAYEPVWAIGTGESATPAQAEQVHLVIRELLAAVDQSTAQAVRLLYGGSVNSKNAQGLFAEDNIDGALVGGAALKSEDFLGICRAAALKTEE